MGGNAIKKLGVEPVRLNKQEYDALVNKLSLELRGLGAEFHVVSSIKSKYTFGDADILVNSSTIKHPLISESFGDNYVKNGNVHSYPVQTEFGVFQVDIIFVSNDDFKMSKFYHGNGDIGNLIGRIARNMGLKFGHDGLTYQLMTDTYYVGEVVLSKEPYDILRFFGLDTSKLVDGALLFETETEMYDYVISSPYFVSEIFLLENRSHDARQRDKKRPSYNRFLEYIKDIKQDAYYDKNYFIVAIEHFNVMNQYIALLSKNASRLKSKMYVNPSVVPGFTGIKLGEMMKLIKTSSFYKEMISADILTFRKMLVGFIGINKHKVLGE